MKTRLIFIVAALAALVTAAAAQWPDRGKLNTWTFATFSNAAGVGTGDVILKEIRVSKNKGFDRLVFEFTGGIPRYQIEYQRSGKFENTGEQFIRVGGKAFLDINLQTLGYPEDPKAAEAVMPKGDQHLPVFHEIKEVEWFEGVRDFGVGLNARKAFRVQELEKPYRLVIDFKQ
jgi:hypothetical protein